MSSGLSVYQDFKNINGHRIPLTWKLSKVKFIGEYLNGFAFKPTHWSTQGVPIIRIQNLSNPDSDINRTSFIPPARYQVMRGDILISWSATLDVFIWDGEPAWLNQHIFRVDVNKHSIFKKYFYWAAKWFMRELNESSHGSTMQHLTTDKFGGFSVPLPIFEEQQKISDFLDHETAKIDTLIEKQQQLIKLLKEKRQAVISHAVTKGLNPDAPMRDSGVEWLGDVPEHWVVASLKYLVSAPIIDGPHLTPQKHESGIPFISAEAVSQGYINFEKKWGYISEDDHKVFSKRYCPQRGDILVVKLGATTGVAAIVETDKIFNVWVPLATIRSRKGIPSKYIFYLFQSVQVKDAIQLSWTFGTQQTLGLGTLANLSFPAPVEQEMINIINFIESQIPVFDNLINKAVTAIELMKERRTALISAAVTGKIDVRDWQAPEPSVSETKGAVA
ncbi:restriction endonuclease subunit S [Leucothrix mucor]|uniref:restriction endonuclease subunit S n=1 Tax=Leucothrix mucor TaxID=45248 RepID=UPI0003B57402|nr:restriction endonuclease subunit S [Leucothrix mucor]